MRGSERVGNVIGRYGDGERAFPVIFLEVEGRAPCTQLQIGTNVSKFATWLSGRGLEKARCLCVINAIIAPGAQRSISRTQPATF